MRSHTSATLLTVVITLLSVAVSATTPLPVAFKSALHPKSLLLTMEVEPDSEFKLKSGVMITQGSHWTTVSSYGQRLSLNPSPPHSTILFNQRHEGKHLFAFQGQLQVTPDRHLNYIEVEHNSQNYNLLLPLFSHDLPAIRTDTLYRCQNVLVSVEWKGNDAHVVAFSTDDHKWNILDSVDRGYSSQDRGVRYASIVDSEHKSPIRVEIDGNKYCLISKDTEPATIRNNWNKGTYAVDDILDLVLALPLKDKNDIDEL